jgi:hypothetical protein
MDHLKKYNDVTDFWNMFNEKWSKDNAQWYIISPISIKKKCYRYSNMDVYEEYLGKCTWGN